MMRIQTNQMAAASTNSVPVEEFINKPEVARRLKKEIRTVDNWRKRGILPYYKIGRSVAFKWSEIEAALARTCRVCRGWRADPKD